MNKTEERKELFSQFLTKEIAENLMAMNQSPNPMNTKKLNELSEKAQEFIEGLIDPNDTMADNLWKLSVLSALTSASIAFYLRTQDKPIQYVPSLIELYKNLNSLNKIRVLGFLSEIGKR